MPELPEVETVARGLRARIVGETLQEVLILHPTLIVKQDREHFRRQLEGATFEQVGRRAKFLLFSLGSRGVLLGHLRMTGKFIVSDPLPEPGKHHRVWLTLESGKLLIFEDMRCFGTLEWFPEVSRIPQLQALGPEPLSAEFNRAHLEGQLAHRRREIKPALLDQRLVAGIGNIYASEILFRIGVHPTRAADQLNTAELEELVQATQQVLTEALLKNGTSISDFRRVDDKTGEFQNFLQVYDRTGQPCRQCGTSIERLVQQQRSTFYCPKCQR